MTANAAPLRELTFGAKRNTTPAHLKSSVVRSKSITAAFTPDEFQRLERVIGEQKPGSWAHDALLALVDRVPFEHAILAELLALRVIVLNFHRAALAGETLTYDVAREHVETADRDKAAKARALLGQVS